ncbi:MAG TPA: hypothetical protein VHW03_07580 [Chthoniobacterales bacterium]|nr:hypothetical protein [Chthoniobacterales bacterium]
MLAKQNHEDLEIYLKDHYAGAIGALELLEHLGEAHRGHPLGDFFHQLHIDVQADHEQLHHLMTALDMEKSAVRDAGAWVAEKFSRAKLGFITNEDPTLRLLQALETLYIGITGKKLLWRALRAARESSPILEQTDFDLLEKRAVEQAERIDAQRLETARQVFGAA